MTIKVHTLPNCHKCPKNTFESQTCEDQIIVYENSVTYGKWKFFF